MHKITTNTYNGKSPFLSQVQDAQATMRLYTLVKKQWEAEIKASQKDRDSDKKRERKPKRPKNRDNHRMGL